MATFTVTTSSDVVAIDGTRSLREAVAVANANPGADQIAFLSSLEGTTLTLTKGELVLAQDITIDGDQNNDAKEVILSGGDTSRILHVTDAGTDAQLRDLTLTHGRTTGEGEAGGAVLGDEGTSLRLDQTTVHGNHTTGYSADGGGIVGPSVTLVHSTVSGNSAYRFGGGISAATVSLIDSTISSNRAQSSGGGIYGDTVTMAGSTVSGNYALRNGGGISGGAVAVTDSSVHGNSTYFGNGGGIYGTGVSLFNSTVSGNSTLSGSLVEKNGLVAGTMAGGV